MSDIRKCLGTHSPMTVFVVRCLGDRNWDVSSVDRRTGGTFCSQDEAHRFARAEARNWAHAEVVVVSRDGIDIELFDDSACRGHLHFDRAPRKRELHS